MLAQLEVWIKKKKLRNSFKSLVRIDQIIKAIYVSQLL